MTIKHTNLVSSKKAPKRPNLTPSNNLMENLLKLCAGLKQEGLSKYADELEINFLNYKQAQTLYEAHKEKGEDLINSAHPDGSHKLEGLDGDSVIETILDQHLKILEKVNKHPTGKLSSASKIINAVKLVFAATITEEDRRQFAISVLKEIPNYFNDAQNTLKNVKAAHLHARLNKYQSDVNTQVNQSIDNPSLVDATYIGHIINILDNASTALDWISKKDLLTLQGPPGWFVAVTSHLGDLVDVTKASWEEGDLAFYGDERDKAQNSLEWAKKRAEVAIEYLNGTWDSYISEQKDKKAAEEAPKLKLQSDINEEVSRLMDWNKTITNSAKLSTKQKTDLSNWINNVQIPKVKAATDQAVLQGLNKEDLNFYNSWIKPIL